MQLLIFASISFLKAAKNISISKSEFKTLSTKESYFIFNDKLYQQIKGAATGSPLGPTKAKAFFMLQ